MRNLFSLWIGFLLFKKVSVREAVKAADRRAAPEKREERSRAMVDLGPNATPLEKVKAYRRSLD